MKKSILFVDDEPNILAGIRRMLHQLRGDYDLRFSENGEQALESMAERPADVIVSDMRMPGMDGAELLATIQQQYPHTIRIMLTGQADDTSILKTVTVVHQLLAKPCEPERLKEVLHRAAALHNQLTDGHLKDLITGISSLPSLPSVYARLQDTLKDPEACLDDVAAIIEQDIAMTAKLLQLVNSSFFGLYQKVESPARAVKLLGLDTIKVLVLGIQIFSELKAPGQKAAFATLWQHSMAVAQCSKRIATEASDNLDLINNSFIAGMLHDIGRLLLMSQLGGDYAAIIETARQEGARIETVETRQLQTTHADIGAYLIGLWGFNGDIMEAIIFHHQIDRLPAKSFSAALAVHLANHYYYLRYPEHVVGQPPPLNTDCLAALNCADEAVAWMSECQALMETDEDN
ncbi:response regulator [Desulfofustis glycolicus]|uniref:Response regulator receiver domain-containing protein n=1 Tax=Desulfofustis glycolicus DSM 9705 TaxID=1121409 RepID=A0A1M5V5Q4_9BACT|nr:response regulator [Desulfofustis glycolicus]MCB2214977.1 HDOD domain-containing protein [Desulfobulbaceae bacterium]SHH70516.1 Response regulator receiver domain-containing protein [Desulfofustis glycolicus DSM 9705]